MMGGMNSTTPTDVTFETLARAEPKLAALAVAAEAVRAEPDKPFCANRVWHSGLKPIMVHFVGHDRGYPPEPAQDPGRDSWQPVDLTPHLDGSREERRAPAGDNSWEEFLRTSEAYSIAYKHLYGLLPDCRDCLCF